VNDDSLRSVIVAQHIVHNHIIVQVWVRFRQRYAIVGSLCSRPVDVDGSLFARVKMCFLLQANSQRLVVAFEKFADIIVSTSAIAETLSRFSADCRESVARPSGLLESK